MAIDMDEVFSYRTTKEVRMLDRRLGMVCWLIRGMVLVYVVGYVFLYREGYAETEKGVGHVISRVNGSTYSMVKPGEGADDQMPVPRPWDAIDAAVPALENGAAFIGTTIHITPKQRQMPGSNPNTYCDVDAQCAEPEVRKDASTATKQKRHELNSCVNTHCWQMLWSPAYPLETEEHALETANQLTIRLQPAITFPGLDESVTFQSINVGSPTTFAGSDVKVDPPLPTPGSDDRDGRTSSTVGGHNEKIPDLYKIGAPAGPLLSRCLPPPPSPPAALAAAAPAAALAASSGHCLACALLFATLPPLPLSHGCVSEERQWGVHRGGAAAGGAAARERGGWWRRGKADRTTG